MNKAFIKFRRVVKSYKMGDIQINANNGVDFTVDQGQFMVIVGASGAGKTTILNLLGGMDTPTSGSIVVDGVNIASFNEKQLTEYRRDDIGFVFQFYNLVQNLTALENVELASQISKNPLDCREILDRVGLTERRNNFPSQLSGGEQQRVAIARAIAKNPKLLLCDEPTGALDYQTGKSILKLLREMCDDYHMTVIVITHNQALAPMADKVIHLKNGKVIRTDINDHPVSIDDIEW
ncbi:MAG: ABC transporter ATP-binding protein [Erysipelotrichaceae bacterium]|nr:ABC transporter ATP-binding protein [Erysipelotrichaceae bacterium]